ncbi:Hsp90 cochaperone [Coemansia thaxteri]|uniref:Hsp90 cochaperone n=1 Tax=Coemansia thaxteri TaxID=2663907 RepID=A0A9W8EKS3_9FUNG|nr:Hsp90 cochaperone [Coemansia thaxteri]KAJ2009597.1 Hsp90 cochaperone [Coemansia thaxteri]KAJ2473277.1 Hsp90 cochaperone [Coemansia sp. RSA 2322]KAJ2486693.1 Hsp90 cochaperone [Coemansia sp. RSA 2320]
MSTANELKAKGNEAFAAGSHTAAIEFFSQAIELDSSNHVLYSNRSASLSSLKRYAEALADAEKTVELMPTWPKGYSRKGAALFGMHEYEKAEEAYKDGLKHDPENALLKKGLSDAEAALDHQAGGAGYGDFANQMANVFQGDVLGKIAANPKTASYLADPEFVRKIRDIQENSDNLSKYADDQRITIAMLTLMGMGDVFTKGDGDFMAGAQEPKTSPPPPQPAAAARSQPAATPEPERPEELSEEAKEAAAKKAQAAAAKDKGNAAYKARQFDEALEHYSKAIELDSSDITFWNNKSAVFFEMGKFDECIETAKQAIEVGREYRAEYKLIAKAMGRIGTAYSKKDDLDKAIEYYSRSLTEHRAADVLSKLRALEKLRKQREEDEYRSTDLADAARERGNDLFKAGKYAEAQVEYTEAIKRNPDDARNYSNRAACLTKLIAVPDAIKDCDKCISLDPTFIKGYIRKANALFLMREYAEALDALEEAKLRDEDKKNAVEISQIEVKAYTAISEQNARQTPEEALARAQANPRIAAVLANPVMQNILQQMQSDPRAAREHLKNPAVASNLRKLIAAGIVRMG